jgi:ABC-type nitrate/sulfonate/bicarbonate transport system ATPase subunit
MLSITDLSIAINGQNLFLPINMNVETNSITVLMGNSGIGKTSILNAISGNLKYNGNIACEKHFTIFQDNNQLFPWYSIRKNLDLVCNQTYILTVRDWNLEHLLDYKPDEISGGERQRFTLIRGMYSGAKILLCDEPLSGLDSLTRYFVLKDFKNKITELNLSCLWITHDLREAKFISNNIKLLTKTKLLSIKRNISEQSFIKKLGN